MEERTETAQSPVLKHGHPSSVFSTHQSLAWRWFAGWTNSFAHSSTSLISLLSAGFAVITFACNFNLTRNKLTHIQIIRYECGCVCVCVVGESSSWVVGGLFTFLCKAACPWTCPLVGCSAPRSWPVKCVWVGYVLSYNFSGGGVSLLHRVTACYDKYLWASIRSPLVCVAGVVWWPWWIWWYGVSSCSHVVNSIYLGRNNQIVNRKVECMRMTTVGDITIEGSTIYFEWCPSLSGV